MYGKEGARKNYTPFSCTKIILGTPPEIGAFHGCPYKHLSDGSLMQLLGTVRGLDSQQTSEITRIAKNGDYQLACQKHFDYTHPNNGSQVLFQLKYMTTTILMFLKGDVTGAVANHPNLWFQTSVTYHKNKQNAISGGIRSSGNSFSDSQQDGNVPNENAMDTSTDDINTN